MRRSIFPREKAAYCISIGRIYITRIGVSVLLLGVLVSHVSRQMFNSSYKRYCSYLREWRNFVKILRWGWGAKLNPIFPNQVKMIVKMEKWAIYYHRGKDILKKTDLFLWMLELWRLILVLTRFFFAETKFQPEGKMRSGGANLGLKGAVASPAPYQLRPFYALPINSTISD